MYDLLVKPDNGADNADHKALCKEPFDGLEMNCIASHSLFLALYPPFSDFLSLFLTPSYFLWFRQKQALRPLPPFSSKRRSLLWAQL